MRNGCVSILLLFILTTSCKWGEGKAEKAANKTGEVVAKTGSEFVDGIRKGIEKSFSNEVMISENLKAAGLLTGKIVINSTDSTTDNILSAYLIFEKYFNQQVSIKIFDEHGFEYGRTSQSISGRAGEAKYIDFTFDKRTNIDGKGKISFE